MWWIHCGHWGHWSVLHYSSVDPECLYLIYWQITLAGSGQASLVQAYLWLCSLSCQLWYLSSSHACGRSVQCPLVCNVGSRHQASCSSSAWVLISCPILVIMSFPFGELQLDQGFEDWGFGFYSNPKEICFCDTAWDWHPETFVIQSRQKKVFLETREETKNTAFTGE